MARLTAKVLVEALVGVALLAGLHGTVDDGGTAHGGPWMSGCLHVSFEELWFRAATPPRRRHFVEDPAGRVAALVARSLAPGAIALDLSVRVSGPVDESGVYGPSRLHSRVRVDAIEPLAEKSFLCR